MKLDVTVMDQHYRDQLRSQREDFEMVPRNFYLKERDFESAVATPRAAQGASRCSRERMPSPRSGGDERRRAP